MRFSKGVRIVPAAEGMSEVMDRLQDGELVAFPTETVYGLGADATNPAAVEKIFALKGRPATNPLIVHFATASQAVDYVQDVTQVAEILATTFWPGPLTLVLERNARIPDIVTAGGKTVGLRVPNHPIALELLRHFAIPVAAPSANRSEEVSPTTAQHVADSLGPYTDNLLILDGGPCQVGLESTVLDLTTRPPRILRPGMVTVDDLRDVIGSVATGKQGGGIARSPGQMLRHYAPSKPVLVVAEERLAEVLEPGDSLIRMPFPCTPEIYARRFYSLLREADKSLEGKRILIEEPPQEPGWEAIHDRLRRATAKPERTS